MKLEELYISLLEQDYADGADPQPDDELPWNNNDGEGVVNRDVPNDDDVDDGQTFNPPPVQPKKPSKKQLLIARWKQEEPNLDDLIISQNMEFFHQRKGTFKPFKGTVELPDNRNQPEISAFKQRFPDFPAENPQFLKNIEKYSWRQLYFLVARFINENEAREFEFSVEGDTPQDRIQSAIRVWDTFPARQKIVNEPNFIVIKIESKSEAAGAGKIEALLQAAHPIGNLSRWCIIDPSLNWYKTYRETKGFAFYFVMDKSKPVQDEHFVSTISVTHPDYWDSYGKYRFVPRQNGEERHDSWDGIVRIHPKLADKEHLFKHFPQTPKERKSIKLDQINFKQGSDDDLAIQPLNVQRAFVEDNRTINSPRVLRSLPKDLQHLYVDTITPESANYKEKFKCAIKEMPFGMIDSLSKDDFNYLNNRIIKSRLGIPSGVNAIRINILKTDYSQSFRSISNNSIRMFKNINGNSTKFGVMNIAKLEWIYPLGYTKKSQMVIAYNGTAHLLYTYHSPDSQEFYFLIKYVNIKNKTQDRFKGEFLDKEQGEIVMNNSRKL